jgi:hypothetical protein
MPESITTCGLLLALSFIETCPPLVAPVAVGLKSMPITQLIPAASGPLIVPPEIGQVVTALVSSTNGPLNVKFVNDKLLLWLFVTVIVFAALVEPTASFPKLRIVGEAATGTTPAPESVTTCGLLLALSCIATSPPLVAPVAVGWKSMPITQLDTAASGPLIVPAAIGQVVTALVSSTNGPLNVKFVNDKLLLWLFVTVIVIAALVEPTVTLPKLRLAVESETGGMPVPTKPTAGTGTDALVLNVRVPAVCGPIDVGVKLRTTVQLPAAATVPEFVHVDDGSLAYSLPAVTLMELIVREPCWLLVTVTVERALFWLSTTLPKLIEVVDNVTCETAVPDKVTFCEALPVEVMVSVLFGGMLPDLGLKVRTILQLSPTPSVLPFTQVVVGAGDIAYSVSAGSEYERFWTGLA